MDFLLGKQQQSMRRSLHELLGAVCPPEYVLECDRTGREPREAFDALVREGWLGVAVPEAYGGRGGDVVDLAILLEAAGFYYIDLGTWLFRNYCYGADAMLKTGSAAMRSAIIPKMTTGEVHFAFSLTEPDAGSDAASIVTKATRDGDEYRITGTKNFTSGMHVATHVLVATRTESTGKKHEGITNFVIPVDRSGMDWKRRSFLGHHAMGTSEVHYDRVAASPTEILGELNEGWTGLMSYLTTERLCLSAVRTGAAASALMLARAHADEHARLGRAPEHQRRVRATLTEMHILVDTARLWVYRFAWLVLEGKASRLDAASLKLYASEAYQRVSELGMQVMGLDGSVASVAMERHYRDAQIGTIGAGTSEVQRNIIAKAIGL